MLKICILINHTIKFFSDNAHHPIEMMLWRLPRERWFLNFIVHQPYFYCYRDFMGWPQNIKVQKECINSVQISEIIET